MFYQIFLSPRWAIITYKHGIYELPHELPTTSQSRQEYLISGRYVPLTEHFRPPRTGPRIPPPVWIMNKTKSIIKKIKSTNERTWNKITLLFSDYKH